MAMPFCENPSEPERQGTTCDPFAVAAEEEAKEAVEDSGCTGANPLPGRTCDAADHDGLTCGVQYSWTGCLKEGMACAPSMECTCNNFGNGIWECRNMAMPFCENPSEPERLGTTCIPASGGKEQLVNEEPMTTTTNADPISFYGLNYNTRKGPDWAADRERCKSRAEVVRDLRLLGRITRRIRILSLVDCDQGALVWSVLGDELADASMEVWLGLWVGPDEGVFVDEYDALAALLPEVLTDPRWRSRLSGISVGSEAIYREDITVDRAIDNLDATRALLAAFGATEVPVAIVDIAPVYSNSQNLRLASDVIMTNTFPFWEGLPVEMAVDELEIDLGWLVNLPEAIGKPFVLSEHGWPSGGFLEDVGVASPEHQLRYLRESHCYLREKGWANYFFTAIDNDWRQEQDPDNTIEGNWGFLAADLKLKDHFAGFEFECPDGSAHSFGAVDWTVPELAPEDPADPSRASCGLWSGCESLVGDCCPTPTGEFLGCCRDELFLGDRVGVAAATDAPTEEEAVVVVVPVPAAPPQRTTAAPTRSPVTGPPSDRPTKAPTADPTRLPTTLPTAAPTGDPPTRLPTRAPTTPPTAFPSDPQVAGQTAPPTREPTGFPTMEPSGPPSVAEAAAEGLATTSGNDVVPTAGIFPPWKDDNDGTEEEEEGADAAAESSSTSTSASVNGVTAGDSSSSGGTVHRWSSSSLAVFLAAVVAAGALLPAL